MKIPKIFFEHNYEELPKFYKDLDDLTVYFIDGEKVKYKNCEYNFYGDHLVIFQFIHKIVIPLKHISYIDYSFYKYDSTNQ